VSLLDRESLYGEWSSTNSISSGQGAAISSSSWSSNADFHDCRDSSLKRLFFAEGGHADASIKRPKLVVAKVVSASRPKLGSGNGATFVIR